MVWKTTEWSTVQYAIYAVYIYMYIYIYLYIAIALCSTVCPGIPESFEQVLEGWALAIRTHSSRQGAG